jgi:hypothetical protein
VGYFTVNPFIGDGFYDVSFLSSQPAEFENEYLRHVRFRVPLTIRIDGKTSIGVIYKPDHT